MRPNDMLRRDFIRWMALAGASTTLPGMALLPRAARAASTTRPPLFVSVEAVGAYDITLFCDPRGNTGSNPPNHGYAPQDIRTIGAFKVAPQFGCVVDFFSAYYAKMLVINGVDANTIDHATGERSSMSGYDGVGYPVTGALVGAIAGVDLPAPFMSNGGSNYTANIVGMTQLGGGIADALLTPMAGNNIHRPEVWSRLQQAMSARLARDQQAAVASQRTQRLKLMQQALVGADAMSSLTNTITDLASNVPEASPNSANLTAVDAGLALNIRVGFAGYVHNQTAALHLALDHFDTHSDNDNQQMACMQQMLWTLDYLLRCADYLNLNDSLLVHVGSDFARAPYYNNSNNGKDHWPTTSVMMINPARQPNMPVNHVIGGSDDTLNPLSVDPRTLQLDDSGVHIRPGHVHDALRRYLGIAAHPLAQQYDLHMDEQMPLLG